MKKTIEYRITLLLQTASEFDNEAEVTSMLHEQWDMTEASIEGDLIKIEKVEQINEKTES